MKSNCLALAVMYAVFAAPYASASDYRDAPTVAQVEAVEADFQRNGDVWKAFEAKDYERALSLAVPLADQGSAIAQYVLGEMRMVGSELDGDLSIAIAFFERAASFGAPPALWRLAGI